MTLLTEQPLLVLVAGGVGALLLWPSRPRRRSAVRRLAGGAWTSTALRGQPGLAEDSHQAATPQEVADSLVLLVLALRSGVSVPEAVATVAQSSSGPVARELATVVAALAWGLEPTSAWGRVSHGWRPAALAFAMSAQTGASPSALLAAAARRARQAQEAEQARAAARAGVLLVLPLGLGFLPAFVCTAVVPVVLALATDVLRGV